MKIAESRKQKAESRKQKAESRKQKAESRKQKAESRKQKILIPCFVNYKKVFKIDVEIATTIMARDYKGFSGGFEYSNGVIELCN